MPDGWDAFASLLLAPKDPTHQQYIDFAATLVQDASLVRKLFSSESASDGFFLHLDRAISRLEELFRVLSIGDVDEELANAASQAMLLPILQKQDNIASLEQLERISSILLPVILRHPSSNLKPVVDSLLPADGLLERLIAHEKHSEVLRETLPQKNTFLDQGLRKSLTDRFVQVCNDCSADHGISSTLKRWSEAKSLKADLTHLLKDLQAKEKAKNEKTRDLPLLAGLTRLDSNDKKSNRARKETAPRFEIPAELSSRVSSLDLPKPESLRGIQLLLRQIEDDVTHSTMCSALRTFPCRCYRALKDMNKFSRSGLSTRLEQKIRQLASGDWKGKDVSTRAGSKHQRDNMKIPILEAKVTTKLFLLWQIDVGFYEENSSVMQQLVKVWKISTAEELPNSISQILLIQRTYSPETVKMCCERPLQQSDGRFLPRQFASFEKQAGLIIPVDNTIEKEMAKNILDMANKFYTLTEPVIRSLIDPSGAEEFPLSLSKDEMDIVSHFKTSSLILGRSGTGKTTCLVFKILAKYKAHLLAAEGRPIRQLLLTRSEYLASKLQTYTRSLIESQLRNNVFSTDDARGDTDSLQLDKYVKKSATSLLSLNDNDFPFVCTFDTFLDMLEATIRRADRKDFLQDEIGVTMSDRRRMVNFNIFKTEYWEHFATNLTSSCSAELVFSEIMGVIKGSISSSESLEPLSREDYLQTSSRLAPSFTSEVEREKVYTAFERYEKLKRQRGEIDDMDRVAAVLTSVKQTIGLESLIRQCFEEIYVDEVQDLRCLDIMLLLHCLCDARGIHLAGDTAQCISKDSVFRFPEIKALMHDYYSTIARNSGQSELARPVQFSLSRNYRSHQGILNLASFIMQLLWKGFPDTIDKLDPEIGQLGGPRPIIFAGFQPDILSAKMIGLVKLHDRIADFGAEQVILVRDDASKTTLQKKIGEMALVLTILESKGMEFDDVLLYDFFSGSGLGNSYRSLAVLAEGTGHFDAQKHTHLYVAVTRARRQLWLLESSEKNSKPVIECLTEKATQNMVDVVAEKVKVLRAGGSVDPERWFKRGVYLLHQKNFADALLCFKKASDKKGITQCQAYLHDQEARACRSRNDLEGFTFNTEKAVSLFLSIGSKSEASDCLESLGEYHRAAGIWKSEKQYERAAVLFEKAALFVDASVCYHYRGSHDAAVEVLRRGDQFDEMIQYLSRNHKHITDSVLKRHSRLCNILLKQGRVSKDLQKQTIHMLGSNAEKESFFKEFEMIYELRDLYKSQHRYKELYHLCIGDGDLVSALEIVITQDLWGVVDQTEVETAFHYLEAGELCLEKANGEETNTNSQIWGMIGGTPLAEIASEWDRAISLIGSIGDVDCAFDLSSITDTLIQDFVCLFLVAFEEQLLNQARVAKLPPELWNRVVRIIQKLASDDAASLNSLFLLCAIFITPSRTDRLVKLGWQPVELIKNLNMRTYDLFTELSQRAKEWIYEKLSSMIERFDESTESLWKQEFPARCGRFLTKGYCYKQQTNDCPLVHEISGTEHYAQKTTVVLQTCSIYSNMLGLYLQREVMSEKFQKNYLGRRRRWFERLIEELTFVTSFDQAPSVLVMGKHNIHAEVNSTILSCLEDLLFHRLGKEWKNRNTFSAILEQVQLAHLIGTHATNRFFRALYKRVNYSILRSEIDMSMLTRAFDGVKAAELIRSAAANRQYERFCIAVDIFIQSVLHQMQDMDRFSAFQAVLNVFEFAAAYLLCMVNSSRAVAIPWSWAVLHLPQLIQCSDQTIFPESDQQHFGYGNCLLGLARCFWRRNVVSAIKRRNTDLLSVIALNLGSANVPVRGFTESWREIQKVLTYSAPLGQVQQITLKNLQRDFVRSYEIYNEKDSVHVITLNDADSCPLYLREFIVNGASLTKLSTVLESSLLSQEAEVTAERGNSSTDLESHAEDDSEMVTRLQRRWRHILPRIRSARESRRTLHGETIASLFRVCDVCLPSKLHYSLKIAMRAIVFTDAIHILLDLNTISGGIRELKDKWKSIFETTTSTTALELLDSVLVHITECESAIDKLRQTWSINGLAKSTLLSSPRALKESAIHALHTLQVTWHEIETATQNLANAVKHA
ncbi:hypothetical protein PVAR5_0091 [Paecilomyces variotii No. 5]|uniref:UvrD-like helicase ATP-binding domain-containing protein n=1 Tax=Byssochlamys spectabilis (strain No. 5 / NBRC 109023) TaxID=1356009 RepID=V5F6Z0_BYSSN|nr:hypothetical protein PVAR5_0091 [Paecilomyces variotii No. 5]